jgi:hypothetical protein
MYFLDREHGRRRRQLARERSRKLLRRAPREEASVAAYAPEIPTGGGWGLDQPSGMPTVKSGE